MSAWKALFFLPVPHTVRTSFDNVVIVLYRPCMLYIPTYYRYQLALIFLFFVVVCATC